MQLVWYGHTFLYSGKCKFCSNDGFILKGVCSNCNKPIPMPKKVSFRRETEARGVSRSRLSKIEKTAVRTRQDECCFYCGSSLFSSYFNGESQKTERNKVVFRNFVSWVESIGDPEGSAIAACKRCATLAESLVFTSRQSAREYIAQMRVELGDRWNDEGLLD